MPSPPTSLPPPNGNATNGVVVTTGVPAPSQPEADYLPPPDGGDAVQDDDSILLPNAPMEDHR
jgi:hypothetical protein